MTTLSIILVVAVIAFLAGGFWQARSIEKEIELNNVRSEYGKDCVGPLILTTAELKAITDSLTEKALAYTYVIIGRDTYKLYHANDKGNQ